MGAPSNRHCGEGRNPVLFKEMSGFATLCLLVLDSGLRRNDEKVGRERRGGGAGMTGRCTLLVMQPEMCDNSFINEEI